MSPRRVAHSFHCTSFSPTPVFGLARSLFGSIPFPCALRPILLPLSSVPPPFFPLIPSFWNISLIHIDPSLSEWPLFDSRRRWLLDVSSFEFGLDCRAVRLTPTKKRPTVPRLPATRRTREACICGRVWDSRELFGESSLCESDRSFVADQWAVRRRGEARSGGRRAAVGRCTASRPTDSLAWVQGDATCYVYEGERLSGASSGDSGPKGREGRAAPYD